MASKTIEQVLKAHDEVVNAIRAQLDRPGNPKQPAKSNLIVQQKRQKLKNMEERLNDAKKDKVAVIKRIDERIDLLKMRIVAFKNEIKADQAGDPVGDPVLGDPVLGDPVLGDPVLGDPVLGPVGGPVLGPVGDVTTDFADSQRISPEQRTADPLPPSIQTISGIGAAFAKRLKENEITEVSQVAQLDVLKLAEILEISEVRAAKILKAAKQEL